MFQKLMEVKTKPNGSDWIIQPKLNGVAACFYNGSLWSKTIKEFPRARFAPLLEKLSGYHGLPLYGELWHPNKTLPEISGECNHYTVGGTVDLYFIYYDVQDLNIGYHRRTTNWFKHAPETDRIFSIGQIQSRMNIFELPDDRIDGLVYKLHGGIYLQGPAPTPNIRKLKKWKECDVEVIGSNPGTGELRGLVGSLICKLNGVQFDVGSGLTRAHNQRYTNCLPKRVKVRYLNLSSSGAPLNPIFEDDEV